MNPILQTTRLNGGTPKSNSSRCTEFKVGSVSPPSVAGEIRLTISDEETGQDVPRLFDVTQFSGAPLLGECSMSCLSTRQSASVHGCAAAGTISVKWASSNLASIILKHNLILKAAEETLDDRLAIRKLKTLWQRYKVLFISSHTKCSPPFPLPFSRPPALHEDHFSFWHEVRNRNGNGSDFDAVVGSVFAASGVCSASVDEKSNLLIDSISGATKSASDKASACLTRELKPDSRKTKRKTSFHGRIHEESNANISLTTTVKSHVLCVDANGYALNHAEVSDAFVSLPIKYDEGMDWARDLIELRSHKHQKPDQPCFANGCLLPQCRSYYNLSAATFQFNIGKLEEKHGNHERALDLYRKASKLLQDVILLSGYTSSGGTDDGIQNLRLALLFSIGHVQFYQYLYAEALDTFDSALFLSESVHGPSHLSVAAAHNCLGVTKYYLSSSEESGILEFSEPAMEHLEQSLRIRELSTGRKTKEIATTLNNLGRVLFHRGNYDGSIKAYEEALQLRKMHHGTSHPDVCATLFNLGQAETLRGETDKALIFYSDFCSIYSKTLGQGRKELAAVKICMGKIYQERREYIDAMKHYVEALELTKDALGEYHIEVAVAWNHIGNCWYDQNDWTGALQAYEEGLRVERRLPDSSNKSIIVTLQNLAEIHMNCASRAEGMNNTYEAKIEYGKALEKYFEIKSNQEEIYGQAHEEIACTLRSMGNVYLGLKNFQSALDCVQVARSLQQELYEADEKPLASTLSQLGYIMYQASMREKALPILTESNRIHQLFNETEKEIVINCMHIAFIYLELGDCSSTVRYLRYALNLEMLLTGDSVDVGIIRFKLAQVNLEMGDLDMAIQEFNKVLEVELQLVGKDHMNVAETLTEIGNVYLRLDDLPNMMKAYSEASRIYRHNNRHPETIRILGRNLYAFDKVYPSAAGAA